MSRKLFCPVCKKHGKSEAEYTSHNAREGNDESSPPLCPILLDMKCNRCGNFGHIAARCPDKSCVFCNQPGHTVYYCRNGPREEIDAFLKQRNLEYEDRKWRNNNNRFDKRNEQSRFGESMRPNPFRPQRGDSWMPLNNQQCAQNLQEISLNGPCSIKMPNLEMSEPKNECVQTSDKKDDIRTSDFPSLDKKDDFPSLDKKDDFPALGKKDDFPALGKKDDFPALGKAKTTNVPKMNFAGIASIMTEPKPLVVAPTEKYEKKIEDTPQVLRNMELTVDEYRDILFNKLVDTYYNTGKNNTEPWDMAYKRIMRTVDRDVAEYERYLASMKPNNNNYDYDDDNW